MDDIELTDAVLVPDLTSTFSKELSHRWHRAFAAPDLTAMLVQHAEGVPRDGHSLPPGRGGIRGHDAADPKVEERTPK